jgi:hypothetical protein
MRSNANPFLECFDRLIDENRHNTSTGEFSGAETNPTVGFANIARAMKS